MKLQGGEEGTIFKSLRIEGEDRVRIEFERPPLELSLDPKTAPGLDWESFVAVLEPQRRQSLLAVPRPDRGHAAAAFRVALVRQVCHGAGRPFSSVGRGRGTVDA